jgi:flagellar basal-body rod protein FlgC
MTLFRALDIGSTGLAAQRARMESVASNLANARTTRTAEGGPYQRRTPVFSAVPAETSFEDELGRVLRAVRVERIARDTSPPVMRFEPGHPDADEAGFVAYPNVDTVKEMVDMLSATRSYEANVNAVRSVREMMRAALEIAKI